MVDGLPNNAMESSARELTPDAPRLIAHVSATADRARRHPLDRCVLLLIVTLVGDPSVAVGQSTISIALKQNTTGEAETRDQL